MGFSMLRGYNSSLGRKKFMQPHRTGLVNLELLLRLCRSLIPTWRFFEEVVELPVLQFRSSSGGAWSAWSSLPPTGSPRLNNLLINPHATMSLGIGSLLQGFEAETIADPLCEQDAKLSLKLLTNAVEFYARKSASSGEVEALQLRVLRVMQGESPDQGQVIFESSPWRYSHQFQDIRR